MEAKLIKKKNGYYLSHIPSGWHIGDTDHEIVKNHRGPQEVSKLSLKNCQAIELGYDLVELMRNARQREIKAVYTVEQLSFGYGYLEGFKEALSITSDKKFSEENVINFTMNIIAQYVQGNTNIWNHELLKESIQSLQQTEWDVEIIMEEPPKLKDRQLNGEFIVNKLIEKLIFNKPKLDPEGCLILKRKSN